MNNLPPENEFPEIKPKEPQGGLTNPQRSQIKKVLSDKTATGKIDIGDILERAKAIGPVKNGTSIDTHRYDRPQDLHLTVTLTKGLINLIKGSVSIRIGKEQLLLVLARSLELQRSFERNPKAVENKELRQSLIKIARDLMKAVSTIAGQAKNTGGVYLSSTTRRLLGQLRATVENICIRSSEDIKIIRQFGFKKSDLSAQDEKILSHLEALLKASKEKNGTQIPMEGIAEANGLIGNMLETPPEEKDGYYLEWAEFALINIAGELYGSQVDLSPDGYEKLLKGSEKTNESDKLKIRKIQEEMTRLKEETRKNDETSTKEKIAEKKHWRDLSKAEHFARALIARMKLTPPELKSHDSVFERMFDAKLFRYIQGIFEGTEMVDEGEQKKSALQFLKSTGYDKKSAQATEKEQVALHEAFSQKREQEFEDALSDLFQEE